MSPTNGLFVIDFATHSHHDGYKRILFGQRHRELEWPSWLSDLDRPTELEREVESFDGPASFAVFESVRAAGRDLALRFALSDGAREECRQFSMHPLALTLGLKAAARSFAASDLEIRRIARVAIMVPGAIPARMVVQFDEAATERSARIVLFDRDDRPIAQMDGIAFGPTRESMSFARLNELAFDSLGRRVAPREHLLQLGLSSLDIVRLVSAVYAESRIEVSLEALLEQPTLERLHALIARGRDATEVDLADRLERIVASTPIPPDRSPLASMQRALWLASLKRDAAPAYIESALFRLRGSLGFAALEFAWRELSRRHESLRSAIIEDGGKLWQHVMPPSAIVRLSADGPNALARFIDAELQQPFANGEPLARLRVLALAHDDHALLLAAHHAVCDGGSFAERVLPELAELYARARESAIPLAVAASVQPRHLAAWENDASIADVLARESLAWANELSRLEAMAPLPSDRVVATPSARGARHAFELPAPLVAKLHAFARSEGQSQFVVALSAFTLLLYRFSAQGDLLIGVPV
ncbi:MAG TPA: condensation domain-containing protein, partial [Polyangiales bacterium]|nr:condensation domain-containing protein [Polyangiales bacterium]